MRQEYDLDREAIPTPARSFRCVNKPVLLIDEAQEMSPEVLSELRILCSADFDTTSL